MKICIGLVFFKQIITKNESVHSTLIQSIRTRLRSYKVRHQNHKLNGVNRTTEVQFTIFAPYMHILS